REPRDAAIDLVEPLGEPAELACVGARKELGVDGMRLGDAAYGAREDEPALAVGPALPTALHLVGDAVEPVGDARGDRLGLGGIGQRLAVEPAHDRGLLDDLAVVA